MSDESRSGLANARQTGPATSQASPRDEAITAAQPRAAACVDARLVEVTHKVWRLGADIDTDLLAPGHAMKFGVDVIAKHCLEVVRPDFASGVRRGDVIVAGPNFGIGSSREQAAAVLVSLGVAAVIAPSYSGLYFRNAFNLGLLLLTCPQAESLNDGDLVALRTASSDSGPDAPMPSGRTGDTLVPSVIAPDGRELACEPIPDFLMDMVRAGGLMNQLRRRFDKEPLDA